MRPALPLLAIALALPFAAAGCRAPHGFTSALWYPNRDQAIPVLAKLRDTFVALDTSDPREEKLLQTARQSADQIERDLQATRFLRGEIVYEANESVARQISEARELTADILFWILIRGEGLGSNDEEANLRVQELLDESAASGRLRVIQIRDARKYVEVLTLAGRI